MPARSQMSSSPSSSSQLPPVRDPLWDDMWYLNRGRGLHMGVSEAWRQGVTGSGVAVTILDDGIEKDHPDLIRNYDPLSSTDINDNDADPNPRFRKSTLINMGNTFKFSYLRYIRYI